LNGKCSFVAKDVFIMYDYLQSLQIIQIVYFNFDFSKHNLEVQGVAKKLIFCLVYNVTIYWHYIILYLYIYNLFIKWGKD